jgi:hypothetical protein
MMEITGNRIHYYHADACAYGGSFESPVNEIIAPQAPMSLPTSGGYGSAAAENFQLQGLLSYASASTQVSGKQEAEGWVTLVTATVEGLNVLDVVTVDRLCTQISTVHPLDGDYPTVSFVGTSIENLKIAGCPIEVTLNLDICDQGSGSGFPAGPCVSDEGFLSRVATQYQNIINPKKLPAWATSQSIPSWISERYSWDEDNAEECGSVLCSVVSATSGKFPGTPCGNVFDVPSIGRVFLGELLVDCKSYQLTMIRFEHEGRARGHHGGGTGKANGHTIPP